jgi:uncharacterized protein (DUF1810 family)
MLTRFLHAQDQYPYNQVLKELQNGRKTGHWIWYIFPQVKGLGMSYNSEYYGIDDLEEAQEYLSDPVLGSRLKECCTALLQNDHLDIRSMMGSDIDAMKLRSSMTLFALAAPEEIVFQEVLETFFGGERCEKTHWLLGINDL